MESPNQRSILMYFSKKGKSTTSETDNTQNGNESSASSGTASVEQTVKQACADNVLNTGGSKKRKGEFVRQYDKKYCNLVFTVTYIEQSPRLLCLVCSQVLYNDALKPSKLSRHFYSRHGNFEGKQIEYFE